MEVPYIRKREEQYEEEEENGVNLQINRKSKSLQHQNISNISYTSSDTSVITTELSNSSSFEYSSTVSSMEDYYTNNSNNSNISNSINGNNNNSNTITNGEKPKINGLRSVKNGEEEAVEALSKADEKASFDETYRRDNYSNVAHQNQDSNGTAARQKGVGVIEYPNNEGDKENDIGSNTDGGLKNLGMLLDEGTSHVNAMPSEIVYDTENTVRKIVVLNDQDEVVETSHSKDTEQEYEEYDVERVIEKQKTHDIICPNCKHCITDRVILKRRKRKTPEPETDISLEENRPPPVDPTPEPVNAISCFSCFSIFIPNGDRFLWWRFRPETNVPQNAGGTTSERADRGEQTPDDDTAAKRFPLWIVTCCQSDRERERQGTASEPEQKPSPTPEPLKAVTEGLFDENKLPFSASHDGHTPTYSQPPKVINRGPEVSSPPDGTSGNFTHTPAEAEAEAGSKVLSNEETTHSSPSGDTSSFTKPLTPIIPVEGTPVPSRQEHPVTHDEGLTFQGGEQPRPSPSSGASVQPDQKPTVPPKGGFPLWFLNCCQPSIDGQHAKSSKKSEDHTVDILGEHHLSSAVPQPDSGSAPDVGTTTPLLNPREGRGPGVSGQDIIKAIVYGGLVECITSLSVITSAAGGDATTLNIVALGLANVAGGLVLLLHNLRVLIHEHTAGRYEDQLGRRDHFPLHAVVAVISYLVFGLLSPVIYGFSFRLSDNKDYKLATLAAASLVCISILSIGKAYVRRQGYIQTILYYLSVGFMVSGVGYVAGDLINMLLKKLGVFDSNAPVAMPRLDAGFVDGAWSSY